MSEERLRTIMRDGLESLPLPSRFLESPAVLATARKPRRPYGWAVAAAVAVLMVGLVASPLGARVVRAVSGWFIADMQIKARDEVSPKMLTSPSDQVEVARQISALKPGETLDVPAYDLGEGHTRAHAFYRASTLAEVEKADPTWPLPSYLRPAANTTVIVSYPVDTPSLKTLMFDYRVRLDSNTYHVSYRFSRSVAPRSPTEIAYYASRSYWVVDDPANVKRETVQIQGQTAAAYSMDEGKTWQISWFSASGTGNIHSTLPLDELVKLVDSIPSL